MNPSADIVVIGAGPAGSVAASMLASKGHAVTVLERSTFPRFSIGESLLPQCMESLASAGLLDRIEGAAFQHKDGAVFHHGDRTAEIYFPEKSTEGPDTAFQVIRGQFDALLADGAQAAGATIRFGCSVHQVEQVQDGLVLHVQHADGPETLRPRFVLDASGFGRVLPRLLDLDRPSDDPPRRAVFKHIQQYEWKAGFDRNKILIAIHPVDPQVWMWVIPLADGVTSIGVVGPEDTVREAGEDAEARYRRLTADLGWDGWFDDAIQTRETTEIIGYACGVSALHGDGFALLGNAGEFIDPVFSSGVTIAMRSASLAADVLDRQLRGEQVDWQTDYADPLQVGVDAFRSCVHAWYDGSLQRIIFSDRRGDNDVTRHLTAILAGYAWDTTNPFVRRPGRFIDVLDRLLQR